LQGRIADGPGCVGLASAAVVGLLGGHEPLLTVHQVTRRAVLWTDVAMATAITFVDGHGARASQLLTRHGWVCTDRVALADAAAIAEISDARGAVDQCTRAFTPRGIAIGCALATTIAVVDHPAGTRQAVTRSSR
jgi:hypothetical protein